MYGQARGKGYEVRLVRVSPWDSRTVRGRKSGSRGCGKIAAILMSITLTLSIGLSILYFGLLPATEKAAASGGQDGQGMPVDASGAMNSGLSAGSESLLHGTNTNMTQASHTDQEEKSAVEQEPKIPLIVLDPGHGGEDEGCMRGDVLEKELNLEIALRTASRLRDMGFEVKLTRDADTELTLEERVAAAEEAGADIYVSIHQNASEEQESSARGIETWYCDESEGSRRLAKLIHGEVLKKTEAKERDLCETKELYVIRETTMPSCLIETGFLSNRDERKRLSDPDYQDKIAMGIAEGVNYYFNPKTMYLTFDDGPSEENTTKVLDILKKHNIKATFFVVGENVRRHPEVARRIVEEGHTIGIHCNRHEYDVIYESVESYLADFEAAYEAVYEVTGVEVKLFRFPGGSINAYNENVYEEIIEEMTNRGFIYFDWNGCLEDAGSRTTPEQLIKNARESTLGRKKVVMLAHDIIYNTTLCLEELIDSFPEYKFEPLTEKVKPIQF